MSKNLTTTRPDYDPEQINNLRELGQRVRFARNGEDLDAAQHAVLRKVYKREGDSLVFDPATLDTPLSRVIDGEAGMMEGLGLLDGETKEIIEERLGMAVDDLVMGIRNAALQALLDWLFGCKTGPAPRAVLKRLFAFVRVVSPDHVWRMSQTDVGAMFGETRAATCEREKREVEEFFRLWCVTKWTANRGGKSAEAREKYSKQKKGNHCRKGGKKVARLYSEPVVVKHRHGAGVMPVPAGI
jgi:hypothetical protein